MDHTPEVWFTKSDHDRWLKYSKTDFRYHVIGGATYSSGDTMCLVIIEQPKTDKRFKKGKRYVRFDQIPCIERGIAKPYPGYESASQILMFPEHYTKVVL